MTSLIIIGSVTLAAFGAGVAYAYLGSHLSSPFLVPLGIAFILMVLRLFVEKSNSSVGISVVVFLVPVLASIIVPDVIPDEGRRNSLSTYYILIFVLMLPLALRGIGFMRHMFVQPSKPYIVFIVVLFVFILFATVVGLLNRNPISYVLGDSLKPLVFPLALLMLLSLNSSDIKRVIPIFWAGLFVAQLITFVSWAIIRPGRLSSAFWNTNLALFAGSLSLLFFRKKFSIWALVGLVLAVFIGLQMEYRTVISLYILSIIILIAGKTLWKAQITEILKFRRIGQILFIVVGLAGLLYIYNPDLFGGLARRSFNIVNDRQGDLSFSVRLSEADTVFQLIRSGGWRTILTGYGFGAQFELGFKSYLLQQFYAANDYLVHNVHIFFVAILFRSGVVGIVLWLFIHFVLFGFVLSPLKSNKKEDFLHEHNDWPRILSAWAGLYLLVSVIAATQFSLFDRDTNMAILLGMLAVLKPIFETERDGRKGSRQNDGTPESDLRSLENLELHE
jgi:hypothetical protein